MKPEIQVIIKDIIKFLKIISIGVAGTGVLFGITYLFIQYEKIMGAITAVLFVLAVIVLLLMNWAKSINERADVIKAKEKIRLDKVERLLMRTNVSLSDPFGLEDNDDYVDASRFPFGHPNAKR